MAGLQHNGVRGFGRGVLAV